MPCVIYDFQWKETYQTRFKFSRILFNLVMEGGINKLQMGWNTSRSPRKWKVLINAYTFTNLSLLLSGNLVFQKQSEALVASPQVMCHFKKSLRLKRKQIWVCMLILLNCICGTKHVLSRSQRFQFIMKYICLCIASTDSYYRSF